MSGSGRERNEKVEAYLQTVVSGERETVEMLREIFLSASPEISEHIKWNSLAFYFNGEMRDFDAKEYRRDLAAVNLHRGKILVIFPTGNSLKDVTGLASKNYPDGRKIVEILNIDHTKSSVAHLKSLINDWLSNIEK